MARKDELVVVATFTDRTHADLAKSALEAAGIDVLLRADDAGSMKPQLAWANAGVQLIVRAEDAPAAREILENPAKPL